MIPTYETEVCSVMATLFMAGPGIRRLKIPDIDQFKFSTTDIAPTICHLLGIDPTSQNEGRVLAEFLEKFNIKKYRRSLIPRKKSVRKRQPVKVQAVKLQGDVTDEI